MLLPTPIPPREAHPALEVLDSRDVPAVLGPVAPDPAAQPAPTPPPNTPAQNAGIQLALTPSQVATLTNAPAQVANTLDAEDAARIARAAVEQGLRDAVGGSPVQLRMQGRPSFSSTDWSLDEATTLPVR